MKKSRIALLAGISSIHTTRWANALSEKGYDINLITQHRGGDLLSESVKVYYLPFKRNIGYFLNVPIFRKYLKKIMPDLLHVHYASGYGTLGRLSGFHPYILSIWGSDVYDFPYQSSYKMKLIQKNLKSADLIASTSNVMAEQAHKICKGLSKIYVTPFGIDTETFKPIKSKRNDDIITIGTVKTLASKYGIDTLIKGFAEVRNSLLIRDQLLLSKLRLLIVGGGSEREYLEQLADSLDVSEVTEFTGAVPHASVPYYLNRLDIYVAASRLESESFGVAVLEASACALPVIVSDVGGLMEVVEDNVTGRIIPRDDPHALAKAIEEFILNEGLRKRVGLSGFHRVRERYTWGDSVSKMEEIYKKLM